MAPGTSNTVKNPKVSAFIAKMCTISHVQENFVKKSGMALCRQVKIENWATHFLSNLVMEPNEKRCIAAD